MSSLDVDKLRNMLPPFDDLNDWQKIVHNRMVYLAEASSQRDGMYKWVAGHDGCLEDHWFRGYRTLKTRAGSPAWTYCCGITLEHFWLCWKDWLEGDYESEIDMDLAMAKELRAHFFCYDDPPDQKYKHGSAGGILALGDHIQKRWNAARDASDDPSQFDNGFDLNFVYHTDPYKAEFGDYIQMQPHEDPMKGGHSAIFISVSQELRNGKYQDCVVVFNSNTSSANAYGFGSGVGLTYYWIDKYDNDGFKRILHFGGLRQRW